MDNENVVKNWQNEIIGECEKRLNRKLTSEEDYFVRSRGGFMVLEMIEDSVNTLNGSELEAYLNSENEVDD